MRKMQLSFWSLEGGEQGLGNATLLNQPLTAFFSSRQCPGVAIRAAMNWAVEQAHGQHPVISGFHSPLEQSVLEVLLTAKAPCVIVIARKLEQAKLPPRWIEAALTETVAIIGIETNTPRLTSHLAARRNEWIAQRADRIVVAHASSNGQLSRQLAQWQRNGRHAQYPASNADLTTLT